MNHPSHHTYQSLIALLEQEEAIYGEMAVLIDEERETLLAMKLERMGEIAARKETLALRIKALDESRRMLARRLATEHRMNPDTVTLTMLIEAAPPEVATRLARVGAALRATVQRCQAVNEFNARAAHKGMDLVGGAIEYLIAQADPTGKVYQAPRAKGYGARAGVGASGFISRRA